MGASERRDKEADTSTCALEDILTCMLDFEPLKDPKVLHCGHTFCQGCLEKLSSMGRDQDPTHLSCPLCNQLTPIPNGRIQELPDNFTILQLRDIGKAVVKDLQLYQDKENAVNCDSCSGPVDNPRESKTARYFCYKCSEHYCKDCYAKHQSSFKDHNEVVDLQSTVRDMLQVYCVKHHKHMKYYCQQCTQALCTVCRLNDHPKDHWIVDIADKETIIEKRAQIRKLHPTVTENLNEATRRSNLLQDVRRALYESYADMEHELLDTFRKLKEAALKQLDTLHEQLEMERVQRRTVFEKHLDITQEDLNFHVSSCQSLDGFVEHILHEDNQFQPLSLYSDLCARMSTLDRFMPEIEHINTMPVALFVQNDKFFGSMPAPGWWADGLLEVSFHGGKLAVTPSPRPPGFGSTPRLNTKSPLSRSPTPGSKGTFFGDDFQFTPPLPVTKPPSSSSTPKSILKKSSSGCIQALKAEDFLSSLPPPEPLSRSVSEVFIDSDDEDIFDRESEERGSYKYPREKRRRSPFKRKKKGLTQEKRAASEMGISSRSREDLKGTGKQRHTSGSQKPSFLTEFFRRSFGMSKKDQKKPPALKTETRKESDEMPLDIYSMLWHRPGDVSRAATPEFSLRHITDACYGHDDSWYLADYASGKVVSYEAQKGSRKGLFSVASGSFKPWGVTVTGRDSYLRVHCTDVENRCIQVFTVDDGRYTPSNYKWGHGDVFNPYGICCVESRDRIVVSDLSPSAPTLLITDMNGTVVTRISSMYGSGESQLKYPWYITADDHGKIYVSDRDNSAVKVFDATGQFLTRFKHRLGSPAGITVDPLGYILVADRSGNHNIAMFTPDGRFVGNLKTKDEISWPQAVACDPYNTVVVTEYLENSLTTLKCYTKTV